MLIRRIVHNCLVESMYWCVQRAMCLSVNRNTLY